VRGPISYPQHSEYERAPLRRGIRKTPLGGGWKCANRGRAPTANDAKATAGNPKR